MLYETAAAPSARPVATLEDYLHALRRRKLLVLACVVLAVAASVAYTRQRVREYSTSAQVLVNPSPAGGNNGQVTAPKLESETALILSDAVSGAAREQVGTETGNPWEGIVVAASAPNTNIISVKATSTSPARAALLANAYVQAYVDKRVGEQNTYYDTLVASINDELTTLTAAIAGEEGQLQTIDEKRAPLESILQREKDNADARTELNALDNERDVVSGQLTSDNTRLRTLRTQLADTTRTRATQAPAAARISTARPPGAPIGISNKVLWAVALVLGFLGGTVLAFFRERLDRSAQAAGDVELALGRRVVGTVPKFSWRFRHAPGTVLMASDRSAKALQRTREAYRRLRSSLLFLARADGVHSIVMTSNQPLEGKSTTAANLAVTLAAGGTRIALVSGDLRRPSLERMFGVSNERGLSNYLSGQTDQVRIERIAGLDNLLFIPAGPEPRNPGELLGSQRFADLLDMLAEVTELILVDAPPLGAAADALAAGGLADGVIVVVDGKRTETTDLLSIRAELERSGATLVGAVLNRDTSSRSGLLQRRSRYAYYSGDQPLTGATAAPVTSARRTGRGPSADEAEPAAPTPSAAGDRLGAAHHPAADPWAAPRPDGDPRRAATIGQQASGGGSAARVPALDDDASPRLRRTRR